ncbi:hypothetical protein ACH5RR_017798 [Cinchona calisaya]|uniref:FBD domain-containing protein n=1 Tax=Cinchona calisaya TaxID=153742 RepID=A0ABD2ZKK4_9GENT
MGFLIPSCSTLMSCVRTTGQRKAECLLMHLRTVKVIDFEEGRGELQLSFLQFLLKNAMLLKKMDINVKRTRFPGSECCSPKFFQDAQNVLSFSRASPDAEYSCFIFWLCQDSLIFISLD